MIDNDAFELVCGIYIEGFSMEAFDQKVAALDDAEFKTQLLDERADALAAFESGNDDWLRARVQAMARLLTLITFSESAREMYRQQKAQTQRVQGRLERTLKKGRAGNS